MNSVSHQQPYRVAVVWNDEPLIAQRCLAGLYRRADRFPEVWLRKFDAVTPAFSREVVRPLRLWRPHGLIVRTTDVRRLKQLRREFPALPFVSTIVVPQDVVDTCVAGSTKEVLIAARDFFHKWGLSRVALFTMAAKSALPKVIAAFQASVSGGPQLICPPGASEIPTPAERRLQARIMTDGLRSLPKPVGMVTLETEAAPILLDWCHKLGMRVPEDVQIIGIDEEDRCKGCAPHLTSLELPNARIGAVALETMVRYLRHEQPSPPPIIQVAGSRVVSRNSTRPALTDQAFHDGTVEFMKAHAAKGITATNVAKLLKVGRVTLYRQFAAATERGTPARQLRQVRLQEACRMLRETPSTVTAIAEACGFSSRIAFVQFFRRQTGQAPTAYRRRFRNQAP